MNRKSILKFFMVVFLGLSFVSIGTAYGYSVGLKAVFCEHVMYDPSHYYLPETTYITGGIYLSEEPDPTEFTVVVEWDSTIIELPFSRLHSTYTAIYQAIFGYVPPTSFDDWENRSYTFKVNGYDEGSVTIEEGTLRELSVPVASYDNSTKTVYWESVPFADTYGVRILNSADVDDVLFNSGNLSWNVTEYTFDASLYSLLDNGAIIAVEARDWNIFLVDLDNTSVYVTRTSYQHPAEATQDLISDIEDFNLPKGTESSLISKLEGAINSLEESRRIPTINKLKAFISQVEAQRGKEITDEEADVLISEALTIINSI